MYSHSQSKTKMFKISLVISSSYAKIRINIKMSLLRLYQYFTAGRKTAISVCLPNFIINTLTDQHSTLHMIVIPVEGMHTLTSDMNLNTFAVNMCFFPHPNYSYASALGYQAFDLPANGSQCYVGCLGLALFADSD